MYQFSEIDEYGRGSSDRPITGSKNAELVELPRLQNIAESLNTLRVLNPLTMEFDKEKTNLARMEYIQRKTKPSARDKTGIYYRKVLIDNNGLINLFFDRNK